MKFLILLVCLFPTSLNSGLYLPVAISASRHSFARSRPPSSSQNAHWTYDHSSGELTFSVIFIG